MGKITMKNERVMFTPTIDWMRKAYDKFNTMFFSGKLPDDIEFKFVYTKRFGGDARFWQNKRRTRECTIKNHDWYVGMFRIRISTFYNNITKHEAELILLHEMIHIYQFSNIKFSEWNGRGIRGCHGYTFTEWIERIRKMSNGKYEVNIYCNEGGFPTHTFTERDYIQTLKTHRGEFALVIMPKEPDPTDKYLVWYKIFKNKDLCGKSILRVMNNYKHYKLLSIFKPGPNLKGYTISFWEDPRHSGVDSGEWQVGDYSKLLKMNENGYITMKGFPQENEK
jgi:hypothetical protein